MTESNLPNSKNLLMVILDLTPTWWGLCSNEEFNMILFIESLLRFINSFLVLSSENETCIIGVTPHSSKFLYPTHETFDFESSKNGQYNLLNQINNIVRQGALKLVSSCTSHSTEVVLSNALIKCLCYYLRRYRELQPTFNSYEDQFTINENPTNFTEISQKLSSRILVIKTACDSPSQYLPLMNAVFTAQKLHIPIDTCIIPLSPTNNKIQTQMVTKNSGLFRQASDLTNGIYLVIPRVSGFLQYLLSVFLPSSTLRSSLLLPNCYNESGVDFRAACFCHKRLIDIGYVCSVCLSVFCEFTPICSTCSSTFTVPGVVKE